uniref:PGG domain-containing protein n=1 Tax=Aegilops tauschii subsp. strangulata TaxID=200361 RepID=A0A453GI09_AEGTS
MDKRPLLAREADSDGITPIRMAITYDKSDVLCILLEYDYSLAYETDRNGYPLLCSAATRGQVNVAQVLLLYCQDAFYCQVLRDGTAIEKSLTCLHIAVQNGHLEFVEFILKRPQLRKLINMQDMDGKTALHYAIQQCDPKLVAALLAYDDIIDTTILDNHGNSAASQLSSITDDDKPLDWVRICYKHIEPYNISIIVDLINFVFSLFLIESMQKEVQLLMQKADPNDDDISLYNLSKGAKQRETIESRKERQSLTQKYTSNTSLVAILLATITFTAAFTPPGGYSTDAGSAGLPIMSKQIAFQAFLVSDTLAMCSSFVVAFICLMGRWEDDKFTTYYISVTKKLTWFAYMATITAFATGLYTVLATRTHWLAIGICSVVGLVPFLTMFIAKWPILKLKFRQTCRGLRLKFRQRQTGKSKSNDMV